MSDNTKCAVITGAAGGIGRELATRLAAKGWHLHLCDVNIEPLESLQQELQTSATICANPLDSPSACQEAIAAAPQNLHALVHLAGIFEFHELDAQARDVYDRTIQHNQTNAYDMAVAMQDRMPENGRMVFASSLAFNRGAADNVSYSMAKGALVGLTRALSRKLADRGILVNSVAPGLIETAMLRTVMSGRDEAAMLKTVPLGRFGEAAEVAGVISFLLSDDASYVTGQVINIDGGLINS